jgi:hypothetical protein
MARRERNIRLLPVVAVVVLGGRHAGGADAPTLIAASADGGNIGFARSRPALRLQTERACEKAGGRDLFVHNSI